MEYGVYTLGVGEIDALIMQARRRKLPMVETMLLRARERLTGEREAA